MNTLGISVLFFISTAAGDILGPYQGLENKRNIKSNHPQNPSCVEFTLQDNLPAETVQLITFGAPEMSVYLAMALAGS